MRGGFHPQVHPVDRVANTIEDVIANVRSTVLRDAVRRLLSRLPDDVVEHDFDHERVRERLLLVVGCLEDARPPEFSEFSAPELLLVTGLLQGLRSELLASWSRGDGGVSADELLSLIAGIESLEEDVQAGATHTPFLSLLTSARGADLIVELAHDLRSPLTSILFLSETLRQGQSGMLNPLQRRQLGIIYSASMGLVSMAADIIDLARGGIGLLERERTAFSITDAFENACDLVHPMIDDKQIELRHEVRTEDLRLGFPLALGRVLLNLTTNAIKFTEKGFVELSAREVSAEEVEFSVSDSGAGIIPDAIPHLFEPFRTSPSRDRIGFSGSGLGLWICRRLVADMGGALRFESIPGLGTRFYFTLHLPCQERPR
jgi:signal transduction histidine kinase